MHLYTSYESQLKSHNWNVSQADSLWNTKVLKYKHSVMKIKITYKNQL